MTPRNQKYDSHWIVLVLDIAEEPVLARVVRVVETGEVLLRPLVSEDGLPCC